jgi:hypothetical protein
MRDAGVGAEAGEIEELRGPARAEPQEALEGEEITDVQELANQSLGSRPRSKMAG